MTTKELKDRLESAGLGADRPAYEIAYQISRLADAADAIHDRLRDIDSRLNRIAREKEKEKI